jgi:benzoyl-CoA reductase subunit C
MGTRYFWGEVVPKEDRLAAIASRYLNKPNCPTKDPLHMRRIGHVLELAKDYDVQGIYQVQQKFCDSHELYLPLLQEAYKRNGLPMLLIEVETMIPVGQIQTRTEAFLEMLETELV